VIPHAFGERAVLKLMYAALLRASVTWQRVVINEFERRQIDDLRDELDEVLPAAWRCRDLAGLKMPVSNRRFR